MYLSFDGTTFVDRTPPRPTGFFDGADFIDARHGWLLVQTKPGEPSDVDLLATSDAGRHWRHEKTLPGAGFHHAGDFIDVHFLDEHHGWLTAGSELGGSESIEATSDGGSTWTTVFSRSEQAIVGSPRFFNTQDGVLAGAPARGGGLYATHDAGRTWRPVAIAWRGATEQDTLRTIDATIVDPRTAIVSAVVAGPTREDLDTARTDDAGRTWKQSSGIPSIAQRPYNLNEDADVSVSAVSPTLCWALTADQCDWRTPNCDQHARLLFTQDSGATWKGRPLPVAASARIDGTPRIIATSPMSAWTIVTVKVPLPVERSTSIYETSDAGRTWKRLDPARTQGQSQLQAPVS